MGTYPLIQDTGFVYGYGFFETIRIYNGRILFEKQHIDRILLSAKRWSIHAPSFEYLSQTVQRYCCEHQLNQAVLNLYITGGDKRQFLHQSDQFACYIQHTPWEDKGDRITVALMEDPFVRCELDAYKSLNYFRYAYLKRQIMAGEERVLMDGTGRLLEGISSTVFLIKNHRIYTPALGVILPGIVRQYVVDCFDVVESVLTQEDYEQADEIFLTNAIRGIVLTQRSSARSVLVQERYAHDVLAL